MTTTYIRNEKGEFVCPECGVTKVRQNTMFYHIQACSGEKTHACKEAGCSKAFALKSGLQQHQAQAHGSTRWACPCCPHNGSKTLANLLIHIGRKHGTGWIPARDTESGTCSSCKKIFASDTAYYYHAVKCFTVPETMAPLIATVSSV